MAVRLTKPVEPKRVGVRGSELLRLVGHVVSGHLDILFHDLIGRQANTRGRFNVDRRVYRESLDGTVLRYQSDTIRPATQATGDETPGRKASS
jgi:hypothetical protein